MRDIGILSLGKGDLLLASVGELSGSKRLLLTVFHRGKEGKLSQKVRLSLNWDAAVKLKEVLSQIE